MNGSLFLFPEDSSLVPAAHIQLPGLLQQLGMAGGPLGRNTFLVGKDFPSHITFAGCSPHLVVEPPADGSRNFSHITLHGPLEKTRLFTAASRSRPRCPHCRERVKDWMERLPGWLENPTDEWRCPSCGAASNATELDWRQYAAAGRLLLEIHNVFPGEAVPGDALMKAIEDTTGCTWCYGWADSSAD